MPFIDTHVHFWQLDRGDYGWLTDARPTLFRDFLPSDYQRSQSPQVSACIAVQAAPTRAETQYLLGLASECEWILGVTGWANLLAPDIAVELTDFCQSSKAIGLRPTEAVGLGPEWLSGEEYALGLKSVARTELVLEALALPRHLSGIAEVARRHPDLSIIINHAAKPTASKLVSWRSGLRAFRALPNVSCKLSGLTQQSLDPDHHKSVLEALLENFGASRVMWGSDFPVLLETTTYREWLARTENLLADLSPQERIRIESETAAKIYGLSQS